MRQAGDGKGAAVVADNLSGDRVPRFLSASFFAHVCSPKDIRIWGCSEVSSESQPQSQNGASPGLCSYLLSGGSAGRLVRALGSICAAAVCRGQGIFAANTVFLSLHPF